MVFTFIANVNCNTLSGAAQFTIPSINSLTTGTLQGPTILESKYNLTIIKNKVQEVHLCLYLFRQEQHFLSILELGNWGPYQQRQEINNYLN